MEPPRAELGRSSRKAMIVGVALAVAIASPVRSLGQPAPVDPDAIAQATRRASVWLRGMQSPNGMFRYGWNPALDRPLAGNNLLRQAGAAAALARSATIFRDRATKESAQLAAIALLADYTAIDPEHPDRRVPTAPGAEANPVGFASLLLLALSELPNLDDATAEQADQIARYLASRQRADGSIHVSAFQEDDGDDPPEAVEYYPGEAIYAMLRSHARRPADWKLDVARKAFDYYKSHWEDQPSAAFVPWQTAAYAEAYERIGDERYADFAFAMADWIVTLQYSKESVDDPRWVGGFASFQGGRVVPTPPGVTTASFAETLQAALRVAERRKDADRSRRYRRSLDLAAAFLLANQYTPANTGHFSPTAARRIVGAFYASVEDGTVRIDFAQHAILALAPYVAEASALARRRLPIEPGHAN